MPTYAKENARRCFDLSQDLNWHGHSDDLWDSFKEKYPQYKDIPNRELKDKMNNFWSHCGKVLIETENGILLDRIGYLSMTVFDDPKKMVSWKQVKEGISKKKEILTNYKAEGEVYRCYFYPIRPHHSVFKGWMFTISREHKKRLKELIQGGMKYKNHIRLLDKNSKVIKSYG